VLRAGFDLTPGRSRSIKPSTPYDQSKHEEHKDGKTIYLTLVFFCDFFDSGANRRLWLSLGGLCGWQTNDWDGHRQRRWVSGDVLKFSSGMVAPVRLEPPDLTRFGLCWTNPVLRGVEQVAFRSAPVVIPVVERGCSFSVSNQFVRVKRKRLLRLVGAGTGIARSGTSCWGVKRECGGWTLAFVWTKCLIAGTIVTDDRRLNSNRQNGGQDTHHSLFGLQRWSAG
jgi:hypothetical protein